MATKFLSLDEAAALLGVSPGELGEMRQRNEIYGYRDGTSWKFKVEEIERVRQERHSGGGLGEETGELSDIAGLGEMSNLLEDLPAGDSKSDALAAADDVVLLSEVELGGSSNPSSSTVIGKTEAGGGPSTGSGILSDDLALGSDLKLSGSDLALGGSGLLLGGGSDLQLGAGSGTGSSAVIGSSGILSDDRQTMISKGSSGGSGIVELSAADEDIFGGGSDITVNPGDSGIMLVDPGDSGLSLEALSSASGKRGSTDVTTQMGQDDDFLLTPLVEPADDDSDSGSQVIALEDAEAGSHGGAFDDATATLLAAQVPGLMQASDPLAAGGAAAGAGAVAAPGGAPIVYGHREHPWSVLDNIGLSLCVLAMAFTGMMMYELMRNIWGWDTPYGASTALMDMLVGK